MSEEGSEPRIVPFDELAAEEDVPGISAAEAEVGGHRWAIVEYGPGVLREEWCPDGHCGFVLEGDISYELEGERAPLAIRAGQAFALPGAVVHRGRAGAAGARLFIIDREPY